MTRTGKVTVVGAGFYGSTTAQRLAEWSARAPEMEEDVALSNIALDQLGVPAGAEGGAARGANRALRRRLRFRGPWKGAAPGARTRSC